MTRDDAIQTLALADGLDQAEMGLRAAVAAAAALGDGTLARLLDDMLHHLRNAIPAGLYHQAGQAREALSGPEPPTFIPDGTEGGPGSLDGPPADPPYGQR